MQTRSLLELLAEIEKTLPDFKAFIEELTELKNKIIVGDFDSLDIKDREAVNLNQLIEQLKSKLANTPKSEITNDVATRAAQAISLTELYIKQTKEINLEIGNEIKRFFSFLQVRVPSLRGGEAKTEEVSVMSMGPIGVGINRSTSEICLVGNLPRSQNPSTVDTLFRPGQNARRGNSSESSQIVSTSVASKPFTLR